MIIYLDCMSPYSSFAFYWQNATYLEARRAAVSLPMGEISQTFGLASSGVYTAFPVTRKAVVSYTAIPSLPGKTQAVSFLLH